MIKRLKEIFFIQKQYPSNKFRFENKEANIGDVYFEISKKIKLPFMPTYLFRYVFDGERWLLESQVKRIKSI